jgi:hypothetical protein
MCRDATKQIKRSRRSSIADFIHIINSELHVTKGSGTRAIPTVSIARPDGDDTPLMLARNKK